MDFLEFQDILVGYLYHEAYNWEAFKLSFYMNIMIMSLTYPPPLPFSSQILKKTNVHRYETALRTLS